jgi:hypothetical protein
MNAAQKEAALAVLNSEIENAIANNVDDRTRERIQQAIDEIERMETTEEETPAE